MDVKNLITCGRCHKKLNSNEFLRLNHKKTASRIFTICNTCQVKKLKTLDNKTSEIEKQNKECNNKMLEEIKILDIEVQSFINNIESNNILYKDESKNTKDSYKKT
jgi:uncharacterized CHY-type Zn-finger protein